VTELAIFAAISILVLLVGLRTLLRVVQQWKNLWDDDLTRDDAKLASSASFYLLIPPTVLLHELGHAIAVWSVGLSVEGFWFLGYMGAVFHQPSTPLGNFAIALAGNVVTLLIGFACLAIGLSRPGHPVRNILWIDLGRQSLFLVLIFYPFICLIFPGDFRTIYAFHKTPVAAGITAAFHAAILFGAYKIMWPKIKARARLLCSRQASRLIEAEQKLNADPNDLLQHRELGVLYFAAMDFDRARSHLDPLVKHGKMDAHLRLTYGTLLVEQGNYAEAIPFLEQAREGLLRPEDREAAENALAVAKRSETKV
jgi:hypothetical protein